jgi:hypothetical protein
MPFSLFSYSSRSNSGNVLTPLVPAAQWQDDGQPQQQPNQGPAGSSAAPATDPDLLDTDEDELGGMDLGGGDDSLNPTAPLEPSPGAGAGGDNDDTPAAPTSSADPLRAERRRSNQLEKELRKARAQLSRFSEINPDERERQLNEANLRRVRSVEKERDEARSQVQNLRKERLMERLFSEAEGRVGGDERGHLL